MLAFLLAMTAIAVAVFAIEDGPKAVAARRPIGLLTWAISGNWPAKIGAVMLLIGVGALLRFAALHFDVPPESKVAGGAAIAALLGLASMITRNARPQRTLSLVLGGSAFGVAYLTAYSAFALFQFLDSNTGIGLLTVIAIATGVFAVTRSALSLALLAMVGAYLGPAFAVSDPGPYVTYGYYAAATLLTLLMVALRGWRPLIHLSFLFTLAGGMFFAWTSQYYTPDHFDAMAPMLWLLVALHVALPLAERKHVGGVWLQRLDVVYLLALPLVATVLAATIAPSRADLSTEIVFMGAAWIAAAAYLRMTSRDGVAAHAGIGSLMLVLGVAARFSGLPWDVIALALSVASLAIGVYRSGSARLTNFLAGLVLVLGFVHALNSMQPITGSIFINGAFIERLVAAVLLIVASRLCRKAGQVLDRVLLLAGSGWLVLAVGSELIRWDLISISLALHWMLLAASVATFFVGLRRNVSSGVGISLALGTLLTAFAAFDSAPPTLALISLIAAPLAMLTLAARDTDSLRGEDRVVAAVLAPLLAAIWAQGLNHVGYAPGGYFLLSAGALTAVVTLVVGRLRQEHCNWLPLVSKLFGLAFALSLLILTTNISRNSWAMLAELTCLGGLGWLTLQTRDDPTRDDAAGTSIGGPVFVIGIALSMQAFLLRWLGPAGPLTIVDIAHMQWPAVLSLLWAAMGACLTLWSRRRASRSLWISGATLLVAAAIKVVLVDFGSLGEIENILAVIAAGSVFMLVGWLAPMPPRGAASVAADATSATDVVESKN